MGLWRLGVSTPGHSILTCLLTALHALQTQSYLFSTKRCISNNNDTKKIIKGKKMEVKATAAYQPRPLQPLLLWDPPHQTEGHRLWLGVTRVGAAVVGSLNDVVGSDVMKREDLESWLWKRQQKKYKT